MLRDFQAALSAARASDESCSAEARSVVADFMTTTTGWKGEGR
jgi:hypothetical protein